MSMPPMPPGAPWTCTSSFAASTIMTSVESSKPRHQGRVLQRQARDLGRIEDALFQRIAVLARNGSRTNHSAVAVELGVRWRLGAVPRIETRSPSP